MQAVLARPARFHVRLAYAALAAALVGLIVIVYARETVGWWPPLAFALGPDVALLLGMGRDLRRGQLHQRAVPLYNLLHRFCGPLALGAASLAFGLAPAWTVGALAWGVHVAVDRAVGYGLRTRDGFQRH